MLLAKTTSMRPEGLPVESNSKHVFRTITDDDWRRALKTARSIRNDISDQINLAKMKLHPANPTPGKVDAQEPMNPVTNREILDAMAAVLNAIQSSDGATIYDCIYPNSVKLGEMMMEVDGYYYFWPDLSRGGFWPSHILHDIARKLDALNEAWDQRLNEELAKLKEPAIGDFDSCQEFTPPTPPKS